MELTKQDTQKAKGIAIIGMVMLHLFCRLGELPYAPWLWIGNTPLIYYLGLFGDICVPIYCFCSGYAHFLLKEKSPKQYNKSIPKKLFRFLCNYWLVVILFSLLGLVSGNGTTIPGSWHEFLGNMLLYRQSYNGAWWFVVTYIELSLLSPFLIYVTKRMRPIVIILGSGIIYFVAYLFRFQFVLNIQNIALEWIWNQLILLGTSQLGYIIGMTCRKERWVSRLREYADKSRYLRIVVLCVLVIAFAGHCVIQSMIVAPITAVSVLLCLFVIRIPDWMSEFLLFMGKHSTNIWLSHMFFYLTLFDGLVFVVKYPIIILLFMLSVCTGISCVVNMLINIGKRANRNIN